MPNNYVLPDPSELYAEVQKMNSFGSRLTGTQGQRAFIGWIKEQIVNEGLEVHSTPYTFDKWEPERWSLVVDGTEIHVSSPFPYSGLTGEEGVTGKLVKVHNNPVSYLEAAGNIGVVEIKNLSKISSKIAFDKRASFPADLEIEKSYRGPVSTSFVNTLLTFWGLKPSGMKALVCIWEDMSDKMVEGQALNFILHYLGVPALWINETEGKKVLEAAKNGKTATLTLTGTLEKAETESFYTVIKGTSDTREAIIVNTHTDGLNFTEENGAIALLRLIKHFKAEPAKRNLIFVFATGHFRLPDFRTGADQATSKWLADNKDVWKGKDARYALVAGLGVEHLGCEEWKDVDGEYVKTNDVDAELVYTGNPKMDEIYYKAIADRKNVRTITLRGHNFMHFGEGQPLFNKGIPEIALVTAPDYLCSATENDHMDKFNPELMSEQIGTFVNCIRIIDDTPAAELGSAQFYSLGLGKLK